MRRILYGMILLIFSSGCNAKSDFLNDLEKLGILLGGLREGRVVDSGQFQCYDAAGVVITCQDSTFPGQDAYYIGVPKPRSISAPIQKSNGDLITMDYGTGLAWTTCPIDMAGLPDNTTVCAGSVGTVDRQTAQSYCNALNNRKFGGFSSWRLPSIRDQRSILIYATAAPFYDTVAFPGTGASAQFWADSAISGYDPNASFFDGMIYNGAAALNVRCVSGPALQSGNFQAIGNGMEKETGTGLVFSRCAAGQDEANNCSGSAQQMEWAIALQYCANETRGGRRWRLPGIHEMELLIRFGENPVADEFHFPNTSGLFWTSTTAPVSTLQAMQFSFDAGGSYTWSNKIAPSTAAVRCVAGP